MSRDSRTDRGTILAIAGLALLDLAMFWDVVFAARPRVLSVIGADLHAQFLPWYEFGFGELRKGNLPLWNPHIFSGVPFLAHFQSALFYPLNLTFLLVPAARAANLVFTLDVLLAGVFTLLWARRRGLHPVAAFVAAALLMFSSPLFLHITAGHLPHVSTMAWAPLLLLAVDAYLDTRRAGWCLVGAAAIAMMIFAGYPQHVFATGIAAVVYAALRFPGTRGRLGLAGGFLAICAGGAALAAVQLLPSLAAAAGSVRGGVLPYEAAARFSLPPENLLTLLAPGLFGGVTPPAYWGRWLPWEATLFFGVNGVALAAYGAVRGGRSAATVLLPASLLMLLLALGSYTPLFRVLYTAAPGFASFRGHGKFMYQATLFAVLLAGTGLDRIIRAAKRPAALAGLLAAAGFGLAALAVIFFPPETGGAPAWWQGAMQMVLRTGESLHDPRAYADAPFVAAAASGALRSLGAAAAKLLLLAVLVAAVGPSRRAAYGIAAVAVAEIFLFARDSRVTFDPEAVRVPRLEQVLARNPGDYRVLNPAYPDAAMQMAGHDIWGDDYGVSRRYAEFMFFTQGRDPQAASHELEFRGVNPLYRMLRLRYALPGGGELYESEGYLPRLLLVQESRVLTGRDAIFAAMEAPDFDPQRTVILESRPSPAPRTSVEEGTARVVAASTDELTIEADVPAPSILLVTDGYDPGWHAASLPGSAQERYEVLPGNYVLRAIPLAGGRHRLRLRYRPEGLVAGAWVSGLSLAAYVALTLVVLRRRRRGRPVRAPAPIAS